VCLCQLLCPASLHAQRCELLIAAASDLVDLQIPLSGGLPDCKVRFTFSSSGALAKQIQNGAPYDLFLSASASYVHDLIEAKLVNPGSEKVYAHGTLALWSRKGFAWKDLTSPAVRQISLANPALAPYGLAAKQALERKGLWKAVQPKLVYGENVRQALQFAESGNADVCLTSLSLVHDKGGVPLPLDWYAPIEQTAAIITRSPNIDAAQRFLNLLLTDRYQRLFEKSGLSPVR
jgi:molybdate transport system substrate-binding protein